MRSLLQLIRQPLRTLAGILVVALAVSVLSVSVSQTLAAANTARQLNEDFLTVALPTSAMRDSAQTWVEELREEHPGIVEADVYHSLASAYLPELTVDNYTTHLDRASGSSDNSDYQASPRASYSAAMLVVTLTEVELDGAANLTAEDLAALEAMGATPFGGRITGTVEEVVGLEEGYFDPTGFTLRISLALSEEELNTLAGQLAVGDRCLVYGMDYTDLDWQLRCSMADLMTWREEPELLDWDLDTLDEYTKDTMVTDVDGTMHWVQKKYLKCRIGDLYHGMTGEEANMFRSAALTLRSGYEPEQTTLLVKQEDGSYAEEVSPPQLTYTDGEGAAVTLTEEEFAARYAQPTIVRLEGSVEDFLAGEDGRLWQAALDDLNVNCHTFPVIGADDLNYVAAFATGRATITQGRAFTEEELAAGAKVCVLSRSLAEANGLSVGDTIDPRFYDVDPLDPIGPSVADGLTAGSGLVNPRAGHYRAASTPFAEEVGPYTIVGLYEQKEEWGDVDNDFYSFTPNTIFVPKAAVPSTGLESEHGLFHTLIIRSDRLHTLQLLTVEGDVDDIFYYYDNGYAAVAATLEDYRQAAELLLPIGLVVYAIVIFLFLFLFPGRQGKDLAMMSSFGAQNGRRVGHMVVSCLGIVLPGTVIGTVVGLLLWQRVSLQLQDWVSTAVSVELDPLYLWAVALLQAAAVALLTLLMAIPMAKNANPMKRK